MPFTRFSSGPLRDSERSGSSDDIADIASPPIPAERPPHPTLLPARGEKEELCVALEMIMKGLGFSRILVS